MSDDSGSYYQTDDEEGGDDPHTAQTGSDVESTMRKAKPLNVMKARGVPAGGSQASTSKNDTKSNVRKAASREKVVPEARLKTNLAAKRSMKLGSELSAELSKDTITEATLPATWGPVRSGSKAEELHAFLRGLRQELKVPRSQLQAGHYIDEVRKRWKNNKNLVLGEVAKRWSRQAPNNIDLWEADNPADLRRGILSRSVVYIHKFTATKFGFKKFLSTMDGNDDKPCYVFDEGRLTDGSEGPHTRLSNVAELKRLFLHGSEPIGPMNFLDIANNTGTPWRPHLIGECDLKNRIRIARSNATDAVIGRGDTSTVPKVKGKRLASETYDEADVLSHPNEFFLASSEGCTSPFHTDSAGASTWILILEGKKTWMYPKGDREEARKMHHQFGPTCTVFPDGVCGLTLDEHDLLVMAPGVVHAVYTPTNCLAVGGHFYTAPTMAASINQLVFQILQGTHENDGISEENWAELIYIMENVELPGMFAGPDRMRLGASVGALMGDLGVPALEDWAPSDGKRRRLAKGVLAAADEPDWLTRIRDDDRDEDFWRGVYNFVLSAATWHDAWAKEVDRVIG